MAQTKRRRQTKHRGNAAGVIEARGRTGRKPTAAEKSPAGRDKASARTTRQQRFDRPPTWRGSMYRSLIAAVLMVVLATVLTRHWQTAVALFPIVLVLYVPFSYYSDLWFYRRRLRDKQKGAAGKAAAK